MPLQSDFKSMHHFLYDEFLCSSERLDFLLEMLEESLETFSTNLICSFRNANWPTLQDAPTDLMELVEILCETRVKEFCETSAHAYLRHVVDLMYKGKIRNPLAREKKRWSNASAEERKELCCAFLYSLLDWAVWNLMNEPRSKQHTTNSHFQLIQKLRQDVKALITVKSLGDDVSRPDLLKLLHKQLQAVINFCKVSIREINPHPSLDVQAHISLPEKMVDKDPDSKIPLQSSHKEIVKEMTELLLKPRTTGAYAIRELEKKLKFGKHELDLRQSQNVDQRLWAKALVNVLSDKDHFKIDDLEPTLVLDHHDAENKKLLKQAQKRLFAHEKSSATCKIVNGQPIPENEIHLKKSDEEENCLQVLVSSKMCDKLEAIRTESKDPSHHLVPVFIPTIRPGPTPDILGNYFLEEDPWSKSVLIGDRVEEEEDGERVHEEAENSQNSGLDLNIFLVVERQQLATLQSTIGSLRPPKTSNINLMYIFLPQRGRGIGVTRAIIKILAECFNFPLYWTVDDDIQFMHQFDENSRMWPKCSLTRGRLFGQRVFQTCLEKTVKELSPLEKFKLFEKVTTNWPSFATETKASACSLLIDSKSFAEVQKNPSRLHHPFTKISEDCKGDPKKEEQLKACGREFVAECRKLLFEDTVNHIAGVSIAHEASKKSDYTSKCPTADYMRSEQRYQVVLHNTCALKGMNFVTDDIIFHAEELQVFDKDKRNTPYWGIRGSDKSFCRALKVSGVIGYQVIRIVHSHKKLRNVFDRVSPSYIGSQSPHRSEDEDEIVDVDVNS